MKLFTSVASHSEMMDDLGEERKRKGLRIVGFHNIKHLFQCGTDSVVQPPQQRPVNAEEVYKETVQRLMHSVTQVNPEEKFETIKYIGCSSNKACNIYVCEEYTKRGKRYVTKVTKLTTKELVSQVENELRLMSACDHPNIVSLAGAYFHQNVIWILTPYYFRGALTELIQMSFPLGEGQIAFITYQLLLAVQYLHEKRFIMHLDIKSDNILISDDYRVLLADFGLSTQLDTEDGIFDKPRGTSYWIAPEMLQRKPFTNKVDIWSLGCTVWEMITGFPPRYSVDEIEVLEIIIKSDAPRLTPDSGWSEDLQDLVAKMLTKDPNLRPSATQLLSHPFFKDFDIDSINPLDLF